MQGRKRFLKHLIAGASLGVLNLSGLGWTKRLESDLDWTSDGLEGEAFWEALRKQYTFLGKQIYFNCATIGLMPIPVRLGIAKNFEELGKGRYRVEKSPRIAVAKLMGASADEICMTHNTTEGINIIAAGLPLRRKDEIIITDQEHVGNALPWLNRARRDGVKLRVFSPAATAAETMNRIEALLTRRTRVIVVPHITCTTGQVMPVQEIAQLARERDIYSFVDGAHGPGTTKLDMRSIGCDFYAACGHKWLCGPPGTGMLYIRKEKLEEIEAHMVGAYSETGWRLAQDEQSMTHLVNTAHRFDYGTQNNALYIGLQEAIEFQEKVGTEKIYQRGRDLATHLQNQLLPLPHIEMLTPTEARSRATMVGFRVKERSLAYFRKHPSMQRFRIRMVPESDLNSLRISTHLFNTYSEIDEFVEFIGSIAP